MKFGYISVSGRPNVGKSTLINTIIGLKVAAISPKPQTTRNRIIGIKNSQDYQIAFIDTPGLHKPKDELTRFMISEAKSALDVADVVYHLVEPTRITEDDEYAMKMIKSITQKPIFCIITKIDLVKKSDLFPMIDHLKEKYSEIIPVSAVKNMGISELVETTVKYLPEGERMFPEDQFTDQPIKLVVAEIIREKIFTYTHQEVPYSTAVEVEEISERQNGMLYIKSVIYTERANQRMIILGKNGAMIKKIGTLARKEIEIWTKKRVYLDLFVKVTEDWTKNRLFIKKFFLVS